MDINAARHHDFLNWAQPPSHLEACGISTPDIPFVPAFANLRHLKFEEGNIEWALITLPNLRHLTLGERVMIGPPQNDTSISSVDFVTIEAYYEPSINRHMLCRLFSHLSKLRKLELHSLQRSRSLAGAWETFSNPVINNFLHVAPSAEELLFTFCNERFLELGPIHIKDLAPYTKIRKLLITEYALLFGFKMAANAVAAPVDLLPPNLEKPIVTSATGTVLSWLHKLDKADFPALQHVELQAVSKGVLIQVAKDMNAVQMLCAKGIELSVSSFDYTKRYR